MGKMTVISVLLCAFMDAPANEQEAPNPYEVARNYCVALTMPDGGSGSGVPLVKGDDVYVLTCNHVVREHKTAGIIQEFYDAQGKPVATALIRAEVVHTNKKQDLALLKVLDPKHLFAKKELVFDESVPKFGARVFHIGTPMGPEPRNRHVLTQGLISKVNVELDGNIFERVDFKVAGGCSGGPVFNEGGKLIGIVVYRIDPNNDGGVIPYRVIKGWLEEIKF
jgi:S1-C subfamily serine protease